MGRVRGSVGVGSLALEVTFLVAAICSLPLAAAQPLRVLNRGDSLHPSGNSDNGFLLSENGTFKAGFYPVGENAFAFSIWFSESVDPVRTVVWMANRDRPVNGRRSRLSFLRRRGDLQLTDADGTVVWITNASWAKPDRVELMESGDLVVKDGEGRVAWRSFDYPTDTLLATQTLEKGARLVSRKSNSSYATGYYTCSFDDDNVLRLLYNGPSISSVYWPDPDYSVFQNRRSRYNGSRSASFNELGQFTSSDYLQFSASDAGLRVRRRLTMDFDGLLRIYSLNEKKQWEITWLPTVQRCKPHGLCGENGICSYTPEPKCTCPPGFRMKDPTDWFQGCKPDFAIVCNRTQVDFLKIPHADFYGYDLNTYTKAVSFEACKNICLSDCNCVGFSHWRTEDQPCYPKVILLNGQSGSHFPGDAYIKVPSNSKGIFGSYHVDQSDMDCSKSNSSVNEIGMYASSNAQADYLKFLIVFVVAIGVVEVICISLGWLYLQRHTGHVHSVDQGYIALTSGFKRFTYKELKAATKNFSNEIGRGGSGVVCKGVLEDGRVVAVKRLEGVQQGEAQFWSEVSTIGRINHMNLVTMWGICAEKENRLLVYEFMENGSLEKILFSNSGALTWECRLNIALGTAKALAYLHHECLEWVLHCDVKPQNILLDKNFHPKVADFGLSKLFDRGGDNISTFSKVRGTRGYLAPEWILNLPITSKVDVYSYGILVLEMVTGRSSVGFQQIGEGGVGEYRQLIPWIRETVSTSEGWIEQIADPCLSGVYDRERMEVLVKIALQCIEEEKDLRPTMSDVVNAITLTSREP